MGELYKPGEQPGAVWRVQAEWHRERGGRVCVAQVRLRFQCVERWFIQMPLFSYTAVKAVHINLDIKL